MKTNIDFRDFGGNAYFVKGKRLVIDSLFDDRQTASGWYKFQNHAVIFHDIKDKPFAALTKIGFVNCSRDANYRLRFQNGISEFNLKKLGLKGITDKQLDQIEYLLMVDYNLAK